MQKERTIIHSLIQCTHITSAPIIFSATIHTCIYTHHSFESPLLTNFFSLTREYVQEEAFSPNTVSLSQKKNETRPTILLTKCLTSKTNSKIQQKRKGEAGGKELTKWTREERKGGTHTNPRKEERKSLMGEKYKDAHMSMRGVCVLTKKL